MNILAECSQLYGLDINIKKTKLINISKYIINNCQLIIKLKPIEQVSSITYLCTPRQFSCDAKCYPFCSLEWKLTEATTKKLEAFRLQQYRRILKIPWTYYITNIEVLRRTGKEKEIVIVKTRKLRYLGHIMRNAKHILP